MPEHPEKNLASRGAAIPQVKSKQARRAEKGTTPKSGPLSPGSEGQPSSPMIGDTFTDHGFPRSGRSSHT